VLTCREFIDFLDDYHAGTQPPSVREEFERHLAVCRHCREYLQSYADTVRLTRAIGRDEHAVPQEVPAMLVQAVLAAIKNKNTQGSDARKGEPAEP
jgi:predicted anti-sigma-YlaC factor YlaD